MATKKFKRSVIGGWVFGLAKFTVYIITVGQVSLKPRETDKDGWAYISGEEVCNHHILDGQQIVANKK